MAEIRQVIAAGGKTLRRWHDRSLGKKAGWDNDYLLKVLSG